MDSESGYIVPPETSRKDLDSDNPQVTEATQPSSVKGMGRKSMSLKQFQLYQKRKSKELERARAISTLTRVNDNNIQGPTNSKVQKLANLGIQIKAPNKISPKISP